MKNSFKQDIVFFSYQNLWIILALPIYEKKTIIIEPNFLNGEIITTVNSIK